MHYVELREREITCKQQNYSFLSKKYVSQALYKTLQTTKMNFEKLLGYDEPTTASRFNLLEVCPCMSPFVIAVLFILSSYVWAFIFICHSIYTTAPLKDMVSISVKGKNK